LVFLAGGSSVYSALCASSLEYFVVAILCSGRTYGYPVLPAVFFVPKLTTNILLTGLFRADKMKIPMEIPEATENATKEVIDFEVEAEMVSAARWLKRTLFTAIGGDNCNFCAIAFSFDNFLPVNTLFSACFRQL
jgi:hypothetical protein